MKASRTTGSSPASSGKRLSSSIVEGSNSARNASHAAATGIVATATWSAVEGDGVACLLSCHVDEVAHQVLGARERAVLPAIPSVIPLRVRTRAVQRLRITPPQRCRVIEQIRPCL